MLSINVTFNGGGGTLSAKLYQKGTGALIEQGAINHSGNIILNNSNSGDVVGINGVCSGSADIVINVGTNPSTPQHFNAGTIHDGFILN